MGEHSTLVGYFRRAVLDKQILFLFFISVILKKISNAKAIGFHQTFREIKNSIVHQYLQFRIKGKQNPYQILFRPTPYRVLFILGHMRAASSLLSHILISNPEIIGYGETHTQYHSELDLQKLMFKVYWNYYQLSNLTMEHKYILDKVLHNKKFIDDSFLNSTQVYSIFLVREPQRTIASILDLKSDWREEQALNYYIGRLTKLEEQAQFIKNKNRSLFIRQEQIIEDTESVFQTLQNFLETKSGFSEKYKITQTTGMRHVGDQTENIKAGRIIRKKRELEIELAEATIKIAMESYQKCCQTLSNHCSLVG